MRAMAHLLQLLGLPCLYLSTIVAAFPAGHTWNWISSVSQMNGSQFKDFAHPLVEISANAYRFPNSIPVPGWFPSTTISPLCPQPGGVHAVVYEEDLQESAAKEYLPRFVLAFRGTQISSSLDSLADVCADKILWEGFKFASLPADCAPFSETTLDYFSQAVNFTLRVLEVCPAESLLLTGHSLGVGLAILVSAALSEKYVLPVIGYGAPATYQALLERSLPFKGLQNDKIIVIAHEWDQITRSQWDGQVGLLCLYPRQQSSACKACFSSYEIGLPLSDTDYFSASHLGHEEQIGFTGPSTNAMKDVALWQHKLQALSPPDDDTDCLDCFFETHYLKNLIVLVEQGERPICQPANTSHKGHFSDISTD